MKRFITSRWFQVMAGLYLVLWFATHAVGAPQVRRSTLDYLQIPRESREVPLDTVHLPGFPVHGCTVVSYAPFVLTARYMVRWIDEGAAGGTAIHLWFGVPSAPFRVKIGECEPPKA